MIRSFGILLCLAFLLCCSWATAQDGASPADSLARADSLAAQDTTGWGTSAKVGMNFSQSYLSNWSAGGKNTILITGLSSLVANYIGKVEYWENSLDLGYGFTRLEDDGIRKSDDRLFLISKYGYEITKQFDFSALLDFRTQFSDGFDYTIPDTPVVISRLMSPAVLKVGVGFTYKPADYVQIFVAPVSNQLTIVLDQRLSDSGAFGVEPGKHLKSELGSLLNVLFEKDLVTNIALKSRFSSFAPYDDFTKMVVTWESLLSLKVNTFVSASVAFDLIYDEKVPIKRDDGTEGPATQIREILAIGFSLNID